jgi:ATP-dependent helicase/nuclease subunit A
MTRPTPSSDTTDRQQRASNPDASAWVSANAGSGKTYVLAQRVVRLLLAGTPPDRILCLTFTKAAAANMANRVFGWLAEWTQLDDEALDERIGRLGEPKPDAVRRAVARRLFAQALETPGGLKILTIHGFCERVLQQFPFEANVNPRFSVLDDRGAAELIAQARARVIAAAARDRSSLLGRAMADVIDGASDSAFDTALTEMLRGRGPLGRSMTERRPAGVSGLVTQLARVLGVEPDATLGLVDAEVLTGGIPHDGWLDLAVAFEEGSTNDKKCGARLREALAARDPATRRQLYRGLFFTQGDLPRKQIGTKAFNDRFPALAERLSLEAGRLAELAERRKAVATLRRTAGLLTLADAILAGYARAKAARGALDFDDLVAKTRDLFERVPASWVLFKLDGGLDHVLVDEAQDTNPDQWQIVSGLTSEFTAGAGARLGQRRTIFAVGDQKQSIYGFQGAAPEAFDHWRRTYLLRHQDADLAFADVRLVQSFRSTPDIIGAVDRVFARPEAYAGLEADAVATEHQTVREGHPGLVEIWPLVRPQPAATAETAWDAPFDAATATSHHALLADRIAGAIARWTREGDPAAGRGPIDPGDVLILVRSRGPLFEAILRALKRSAVPVAGADRLVLGDHIAVLDLLALGDIVGMAEDDLALASVLKSPLVGLDDDDLMGIAPGRPASLMAALETAGVTDARLSAAWQRIRAWREAGRRLTPLDFYLRVLGRDGGRRRFRARLGPEADDVLDEFLGQALAFGRDATPTLAGFLAWMRGAEVEIKRDLDVSSGEVRVMTVHGAKGLEARTVILADIGMPPSGQQDAEVLTLPATTRHAALPVWSPRAREDPAPVTEARLAAKVKAEAEHRRLLYVALTRAEDHLVVAGALGDRPQEAPPQSWYMLVRDGLAPFAREVEAPEFEEPLLRFRVTEGAAEPKPTSRPEPKPSPARPSWADRASQPAPAIPLLAPSAVATALRPAPAVSLANPRDDGLGRRRGVLIHRLAEKLPALGASAREVAAERYLAEAAADLADDLKGSIAQEALRLVADPSLAPLFAPGARAELRLAGTIEIGGRPYAISGRIDRLVEEHGGLLLVDLKTDRSPPAEIPEAYVAQLALYRALMMRIDPSRPVRAAVLWTALPRLDRIDSLWLDGALTRIVPIP